MELKGINTVVKSDAMSIAFKKSGYKLRMKKVSWPKLKGPAGLRVDVTTGQLVSVCGR